MASPRQNYEFNDYMDIVWPLDNAIEWFRDNLNPEDVFSNDQLSSWAEKNGYEIAEQS